MKLAEVTQKLYCRYDSHDALSVAIRVKSQMRDVAELTASLLSLPLEALRNETQKVNAQLRSWPQVPHA